MNDKPKAFVILIPGFASSEDDSTCLPMQQSFVRAIGKNFPEVQILVLALHYPFRKDCYQCFNAKVYSLNGRNRGGLQTVLLRKTAARILSEIHKQYELVGLLSFWVGECALIGKSFAGKNGLKHFCWIMGQDAKSENKYPKKLKLQGNELIALSDSLQEEFQKNHGIKPVKVIPPGIEKMEVASEVKNIDLLAGGSLIPLKQFDIFIEIVAKIKEDHPSVKAMLIGDGPEIDKLLQHISELSLEENLLLAGELPHDTVLALMGRTKLLLHPSSYEGFSGVCLEALSQGANVISFVKPMKEDIENWFVVKTETDMEKKAREILNDTVKEYHPVIYRSMDDVAKNIMELFS